MPTRQYVATFGPRLQYLSSRYFFPNGRLQYHWYVRAVALPSNYNSDGKADTADYVLWRSFPARIVATRRVTRNRAANLAKRRLLAANSLRRKYRSQTLQHS